MYPYRGEGIPKIPQVGEFIELVVKSIEAQMSGCCRLHGSFAMESRDVIYLNRLIEYARRESDTLNAVEHQ